MQCLLTLGYQTAGNDLKMDHEVMNKIKNIRHDQKTNKTKRNDKK